MKVHQELLQTRPQNRLLYKDCRRRPWVISVRSGRDSYRVFRWLHEGELFDVAVLANSDDGLGVHPGQFVDVAHGVGFD